MNRFGNRPGTGPANVCNAFDTAETRKCRHDGSCLTAYGESLLESFRAANPGVSFAESNNPCLAIVGQTSPRSHQCDAAHLGNQLIDHEGAIKIGDSAFVYTVQPYWTLPYYEFPPFENDPHSDPFGLVKCIGEIACLRRRLSGVSLTLKYAGAGRSWYYPGKSSLWFLGTPDAVSSVNAEYKPPKPPPLLTVGDREIHLAPESFDAPECLPSWTVQLPDWLCRYVTRTGNRCSKPTNLGHDKCLSHRSLRSHRL